MNSCISVKRLFAQLRHSSSQAQPSQATASKVVSSCKEGTTMVGLNILNGKQDPIALPDSEYPEWVWSLLKPKKTEFTDEEKLSREYIIYQRKLEMKELAKKNKLKK